jgi:ferredoxin-type protein NapH
MPDILFSACSSNNLYDPKLWKNMKNQTDTSLALTQNSQLLNTGQKLSVAVGGVGLLMLLVSWFSQKALVPALTLPLSLLLMAAGVFLYARASYRGVPVGVKNNGVMFRNLNNRGVWAYLLAVLLTGFYVCLYWYPQYMTGLIQLFEPLSQVVRHRAADQWFVYGTLYTLGVLLLGAKFIYKYRYNRYQVIRTISVMFFQLVFSFLIPAWMQMMNQPDFYFTYFWPLKYDYLFPSTVSWLTNPDTTRIGVFLVFWGAVMTFVATPILTYFFGKRWYCSWVCGCGALAETTGDSFRTLSDKSLRAWKIERYLIYSVLVFITITTILLWVNSYSKGGVFGDLSLTVSKTYSFLIGSMFSGVIGTGFYPILGNRSWCRFGCPQAAILGILQKYFSRFRITTNGAQCISCGNCSTYCEMGIDVKAYAQRGQDIVRASCVGCGICSAVCPRGVLRLENGSADIFDRASLTRTDV